MTKVAFIGGPFMSPYGKRSWEHLHKESRYDVVAFESDPARFDMSELDIPVRQLKWIDGYFELFGYEHVISRAAEKYLHLPTDYLLGVSNLVNEFDIIHTVENFTLFSLRAAIACRGTDTAFTFVANENIPYPPQQRNPFTRMVKRCVNVRADGITAVAPPSARALIHESVSAEMISIVPYDVDTDQFRPIDDVDPTRFDLSPELSDTTNILFVHELAKRKGVKHIVEAFERIDESFPNARLLLLGADNLIDSFSPDVGRQIRKRIDRNDAIHWIPSVDHNAMPHLYSLADVFTLPSVTTPTWEEQFGIAALEAMAAGLPTVVSDSGALSDVAAEGETSLVVPERSSSDLSTAFERLLSDSSLRQSFGEAGRRRAEEKFDPATVAQRRAAFFDETLAGSDS